MIAYIVQHAESGQFLSYPDLCQSKADALVYDTRAGMNIGMRAKTRDAAFVEAIEYWAKRALRVERDYADLKARVDSFVAQFAVPEDDFND